MNPWKQTIFNWFRDLLRFVLWMCLIVNALMFAIFSIAFVYEFLGHAWSWCRRVLFSYSW